jgi:hypothetical protein
MKTTQVSTDEKKPVVHKTKEEPEAKIHADRTERPALINLQQQIGNRAMGRLLAQRSGDGPYELDDDTSSQINHQRGGGQTLDSAVQERMSSITGHDFSGVKVHNDPESNALNEQLAAKAFTTGEDIFFRSGTYNPGSSGGQELLAHELTHVVQQSTGQVNGGGRMTVNAPGDAFEQEADQVAESISSQGENTGLQQQPEDKVQMQEVPEEEEVQTQEAPEEEEVQTQEAPEEEELQAQPAPEEEEVQMQEEEEKLQAQPAPEEEEVQMQEVPEEEEEPVQTQEIPEEEEEV